MVRPSAGGDLLGLLRDTVRALGFYGRKLLIYRRVRKICRLIRKWVEIKQELGFE